VIRPFYKGAIVNLGGLLFIGIGIAVIIGSGKIAEYNRFIRSQLVAKAEDDVTKAQRSAFLPRMRLGFYRSSLEAGQSDRVCFILVGIATMGVGIFTLFHPNGW
jgi:hypothetical protein